MKTLLQICIENIVENNDEFPYKNELIPQECKYLLDEYNQFKSWEKVLYFAVKRRKIEQIIYFIEHYDYNYITVHSSLKLSIEMNYTECFMYLIKIDNIYTELSEHPKLHEELIIQSILSGNKEIFEYFFDNFIYKPRIINEYYVKHIFKFNYGKLIIYLIKKEFIKKEDFEHLYDLLVDINLIQDLYDIGMLDIEYFERKFRNGEKINDRVLIKLVELGLNFGNPNQIMIHHYHNGIRDEVKNNFRTFVKKIRKRKLLTDPITKEKIYNFEKDWI